MGEGGKREVVVPEVQICPRWRVQIEGDPEDVRDLEELLNGSAENDLAYFVHRFEGTVPTLTTIRWDDLADAAAVEAAAQAALRFFSGLINVYNVGGPLSAGAVFDVQPDGTFNQSRFSRIQITVKKAHADRLQSANFKDVVRLAEQREWLFSALVEMSGHPDWYAVFRTIEALEAELGGERGLKESTIIDGARLKDIKRMANSVRHFADGTHTPPNPAIPLDQAVTDLRVAIVALVAAIMTVG